MEIVLGAVVAIVAIALIGYPLFYNRPAARTFVSDGEIRQEVDRYRASIKSGTLCEGCLTANPSGSNYCSECGRAL
jgi:hypothetical protein